MILKICDLTGDAIAATSRWQRNWICAPVNLEKAFIPVWPAVSKFPEIQEKYGRKIRIDICAEEEWATIESMDPSVRVRNVLKEYDLKDHHESMLDHASAQKRSR